MCEGCQEPEVLNPDVLINHIIKFLVTTVTLGGDSRVHSDVTKSAETEAVKKTKKKTAVLAARAPPQRGSTAVSPVGYDFTFAFTIKRSLKVELARRCTSPHREAKQEERKWTQSDSWGALFRSWATCYRQVVYSECCILIGSESSGSEIPSEVWSQLPVSRLRRLTKINPSF